MLVLGEAALAAKQLTGWTSASSPCKKGCVSSQLHHPASKMPGIAIRHSGGCTYFFYTVGSGNGLEGVDSVCPGTQKQLDPIEKTLFCSTL